MYNRDNYEPSRVNVGFPLVSRRWLSLLEDHDRHGFKFIPRIDIKSRKPLGFTFKSNRHGFHGGDDLTRETVILGTSFAMGMSVDEGCNWHQLDKYFSDSCCNFGMPVDALSHLNVLDDLYRGRYEQLIYIYHPNIWSIAKSFQLSRQLGMPISEYYKWDCRYSAIPYQMTKWVVKRILRRVDSEVISGHGRLEYSNRYCAWDNGSDLNLTVFKSALSDMRTLFARFKSVKIVRVPVKEQALYAVTSNMRLKSIVTNYDDNFRLFCEALSSGNQRHISIADLTTKMLDIENFLPFDNHLSPRGNELLCKLVKEALDV